MNDLITLIEKAANEEDYMGWPTSEACISIIDTEEFKNAKKRVELLKKANEILIEELKGTEDYAVYGDSYLNAVLERIDLAIGEDWR